MLDDAALIASELAANAVRYGQPPYTLRLDSTEDHVRITVSNHGPAADPQPLEAADDSHHGRGLTIIASLSADMGWGRDGDRLDVWADLPAPPPPG